MGPTINVGPAQKLIDHAHKIVQAVKVVTDVGQTDGCYQMHYLLRLCQAMQSITTDRQWAWLLLWGFICLRTRCVAVALKSTSDITTNGWWHLDWTCIHLLILKQLQHCQTSETFWTSLDILTDDARAIRQTFHVSLVYTNIFVWRSKNLPSDMIEIHQICPTWSTDFGKPDTLDIYIRPRKMNVLFQVLTHVKISKLFYLKTKK